MSPDFSGAKCVGQHELFESRQPVDHTEAKALCGQCPAIEACRLELRRALSSDTCRYGGGPIGTWAGLLIGRQGIKRVTA